MGVDGNDRHRIEAAGAGGQVHREKVLSHDFSDAPGRQGAEQNQHQRAGDHRGQPPPDVTDGRTVEAQADVTADRAVGNRQQPGRHRDLQQAGQLQRAAEQQGHQQRAGRQATAQHHADHDHQQAQAQIQQVHPVQQRVRAVGLRPAGIGANQPADQRADHHHADHPHILHRGNHSRVSAVILGHRDHRRRRAWRSAPRCGTALNTAPARHGNPDHRAQRDR